MIFSKDLIAFQKLIFNKETELKNSYKNNYELYFKEYLSFLHMVINDIKFYPHIIPETLDNVVCYKKKYECDLCSKTFCNKQNYQKHVNNNYCCKEKIIYTCNNCDVQFKTKARYIKHITRKNKCFRGISEVNRKFKCDHCNILFIARNKCEIHINKSGNCRDYYDNIP